MNNPRERQKKYIRSYRLLPLGIRICCGEIRENLVLKIWLNDHHITSDLLSDVNIPLQKL